MQADVGLRSATDGEFRRTSWHMDFIYRLGGVARPTGGSGSGCTTPRATSSSPRRPCRSAAPIRLNETIFGEDYVFLRSPVGAGVTAKLTIPSPSMVHYRGGRAAIDPGRLPRRGRVLGRPVGRLRRPGAGAGRARLHLPAARRHQPGLPQRPGPAGRAGRARRRRRAPAPALHQADQRRARRTGRPGWPSPPTCAGATSGRRGRPSGSYDFVAEALFSELAVDGFFLEYDDERSGGFAPLRFVPPGKMVVLGLVTTKRGELESQGRPEAAHRRGGPVRPAGAALPVRRSAGSRPLWRATR